MEKDYTVIPSFIRREYKDFKAIRDKAYKGRGLKTKDIESINLAKNSF